MISTDVSLEFLRVNISTCLPSAVTPKEFLTIIIPSLFIVNFYTLIYPSHGDIIC